MGLSASESPQVSPEKAGSVPGRKNGLQDMAVDAAAVLDVGSFAGQYIILEAYGGDLKFWFAPTSTAAENTGEAPTLEDFVPSFLPDGVEKHRIVPDYGNKACFLHYAPADGGTTTRFVVHVG